MEPEPLLGRSLVLVAHPDDECVVCGGLLQRMSQPLVVFATDGAPFDPYFWKRYGSREAYAGIRAREAQIAMQAVGISQAEFLRRRDGSSFVDQELFRNLENAFTAVLAIARGFGAQVVLTLAYEGGHPDHDSCSFLAAWLGRELALEVWEAPVYHRTVDGAGVKQEFLMPAGDEVTLQLSSAELARKSAMWSAYQSQSFIDEFDPEVERFRVQPAYDYARPPHTGRLNYEAWQWKMTGAEVSRAFADFLSGRGAERHEATAD